MCFYDCIETGAVAGLLVVRMVAAGEMTKHALDRDRVRVGAELQGFVIVDESRRLHHTLFERVNPVEHCGSRQASVNSRRGRVRSRSPCATSGTSAPPGISTR